MINPKKIFKNSFFIGSGLLIDGFILFIVFVFIARYLGVDKFGQFVFLVSITSIFQNFASGGVVNITIRQIARSKENTQQIISATLTFSFLLLILIFVLLYFGVKHLLSDPSLTTTIYLLVCAAMCMVHAAIHAAVLRAHEHMGRVALTALINKLVLLVGVSLAIYYDMGMIGVAAAYLLAGIIHWCIYFVLVRIYYVRTYWSFDVKYWLFLIIEAVPLGLSLVLRRMTIHTDTFLLTLLSTAAAAGVFNSAYRVTQMLEVAVLALSGVLFPVFSYLAKQSGEQFQILFKHSLRFFIILSVPIAIWLILLSKEIIVIAYGDAYLESAPVLVILAGSLFFVMPGSLFFSVFSALNKQRFFLALTACALVLNVALDSWLIPIYSYLGAAIATLITEIFIFIVAAGLLYKLKVSTPYFSIYGRCLLSCVFPGIALHLSVASSNYLIIGSTSVFYVLLYSLIIFQLKLIKADEWQYFRLLLKSRKKPNAPIV